MSRPIRSHEARRAIAGFSLCLAALITAGGCTGSATATPTWTPGATTGGTATPGPSSSPSSVASASPTTAATPTPTAGPTQAAFDPSRVNLGLQPVISGLDQPLFATGSGDGSGRFFVVEQPGLIRVVDPTASWRRPRSSTCVPRSPAVASAGSSAWRSRPTTRRTASSSSTTPTRRATRWWLGFTRRDADHGRSRVRARRAPYPASPTPTTTAGSCVRAGRLPLRRHG